MKTLNEWASESPKKAAILGVIMVAVLVVGAILLRMAGSAI